MLFTKYAQSGTLLIPSYLLFLRRFSLTPEKINPANKLALEKNGDFLDPDFENFRKIKSPQENSIVLKKLFIGYCNPDCTGLGICVQKR